MKTMIISAAPGCGKTYLYRHQNELEFAHNGKKIHFTFLDSDSSKFHHGENWEKGYADAIEKKIGTVDFIFVSKHEGIRKELHDRNIPFVVIAPDTTDDISEDERQLIKQQWFGRFLLRDNGHIHDFSQWLDSQTKNYDKYNSMQDLTLYDPCKIVLLKENQYISSVIEELYELKESDLEFVNEKDKEKTTSKAYYKGNKFIVSGFIYEFPYDIKTMLEKDSKYYVLLDIPFNTCAPEKGLRNIYCMDNKANIIWQMQSIEYFFIETIKFCAKPICNVPLKGIYFDNKNELWAWDFLKRQFLIDQKTGKIKFSTVSR